MGSGITTHLAIVSVEVFFSTWKRNGPIGALLAS